MGVAVPVAPAVQAAGDTFEVLPQNWPAVRAFLACETQWRTEGTRGGIIWLGLDYAAVDVVLRRMQAPDEIFADLQLMETAALETFGRHA